MGNFSQPTQVCESNRIQELVSSLLAFISVAQDGQVETSAMT